MMNPAQSIRSINMRQLIVSLAAITLFSIGVVLFSSYGARADLSDASDRFRAAAVDPSIEAYPFDLIDDLGLNDAKQFLHNISSTSEVFAFDGVDRMGQIYEGCWIKDDSIYACVKLWWIDDRNERRASSTWRAPSANSSIRYLEFIDVGVLVHVSSDDHHTLLSNYGSVYFIPWSSGKPANSGMIDSTLLLQCDHEGDKHDN